MLPISQGGDGVAQWPQGEGWSWATVPGFRIATRCWAQARQQGTKAAAESGVCLAAGREHPVSNTPDDCVSMFAFFQIHLFYKFL